MANSERRGKVPDYLRGAYKPEHVRLGRSPGESGFSPDEQILMRNSKDPRVFAYHNTKPPEERMKVPVGKPATPSFGAQARMPTAIPAHVGNQEQSWSDDHSFGPSRDVDNNDYVDIPDFRDPLENSDGNEWSEASDAAQATDEQAWIRAAQAQTAAAELASQAKDAQQAKHARRAQQAKEEEAQDSPLNVGEYVIILDGRPVFQSMNPDEIKQVVEEIVVKRDVNIDNIVVYKRLNLEFGIRIGQ